MPSKLSLLSLPLPPLTHRLICNLTPDSHTPNPTSFYNGVLRTSPSIQRRARRLDDAAHYSHVSPFPFPFPYRIEVTEDSEGLLPCVGVAGADVELELYPEPNRRRVDENSRDGSRREDEYYDQDQYQIFFDGRTAM